MNNIPLRNILQHVYSDENILSQRLEKLRADDAVTLGDWCAMNSEKQMRYPGALIGAIGQFLNTRAELLNKSDSHTREPVRKKAKTIPENSITYEESHNIQDLVYLDRNPFNLENYRADFIVNSKIRYTVRLLEKIGSGGFGSVYLIKDITNPSESRLLALKIVETNSSGVIAATQLMNRLSNESEYFSKIYDVFVLPGKDITQKNTLFIIMEYYEHGSLEQWIKKTKTNPSQEIVVRVMHDLLSAVDVLHKHKLYHRDISLCNLLIREFSTDGTLSVVLNDFDTLRTLGTRETTVYFKDRYRAPEIGDTKYDLGYADLWSVGMTVYKLLNVDTKEDSEHLLNV
jgi:serine/threonine protein kinase